MHNTHTHTHTNDYNHKKAHVVKAVGVHQVQHVEGVVQVLAHDDAGGNGLQADRAGKVVRLAVVLAENLCG